MKKVFINYSWEHDTKNAEKVYNTLTLYPEHFDVWMDKKSMDGGLQWRPAIRKAIREADYFIAVLSCGSVNKRGVVTKEIHQAIDVLEEFPPDQTYLVPARVEECTSPFEKIAELNYVNLFPDWEEGLQKLLKTLDKSISYGSKISLHKNMASRVKPEKKKTSPSYHYQVGLVDLDIGSIDLKKLIGQLNKVQNYFLFTLPEMTSLKHKVEKIEGLKNFNVSKVSKSDIAKNKNIDTDFIACFTGYPLAFEEGDAILYNYFSGASDHDERFMFISSDQLKEFSLAAGTQFEEGLVYMLIGQLINYFTKTEFHDEIRGCIMDFCETRSEIVKGFKKRRLCSSCNKKFKEGELKEAINSLLNWKYK